MLKGYRCMSCKIRLNNNNNQGVWLQPGTQVGTASFAVRLSFIYITLPHGYIPVSSSWIMIEPFPKPEMTIVPAEVLDVANEYTRELKFFLDISGPPSSRQECNGKRWQVFVHVSRSCSNSVFTFGYSSAYDSNLPKTRIHNSFNIRNKMISFITHINLILFKQDRLRQGMEEEGTPRQGGVMEM